MECVRIQKVRVFIPLLQHVSFFPSLHSCSIFHPNLPSVPRTYDYTCVSVYRRIYPSASVTWLISWLIVRRVMYPSNSVHFFYSRIIRNSVDSSIPSDSYKDRFWKPFKMSYIFRIFFANSMQTPDLRRLLRSFNSVEETSVQGNSSRRNCRNCRNCRKRK